MPDYLTAVTMYIREYCVSIHVQSSIMYKFGTHFKDTGTKAYLRERILGGGAYFNEGVCDVNHNSL